MTYTTIFFFVYLLVISLYIGVLGVAIVILVPSILYFCCVKRRQRTVSISSGTDNHNQGESSYNNYYNHVLYIHAFVVFLERNELDGEDKIPDPEIHTIEETTFTNPNPGMSIKFNFVM